MAARGLLRLSNRLQTARSSKCHSIKARLSDRLCPASSLSLSESALRISIQECTDTKREFHSLRKLDEDLRNLSALTRYRSFRASQSVDYDEENEDVEGTGSFDNYEISQETIAKLKQMGINHLFPVQYHTFKHTFDGNDIIVKARTGTGKTLSFALPIVEKLKQKSSEQKSQRKGSPAVIVLAPTRELANQVMGEFAKLSNDVSVTCVYGGADINAQIQTLRRGVDVVVGTPGRVMDLMERRVLNLSNIEHVVLDEVDQMLDMGFDKDVDTIIRDLYTSGVKPQTMLYSATVPDWVLKTARKYLSEDYKLINLVGKNEQTATTIKQYAICCRPIEQPTVIKDLIKLYSGDDGRAIVFCQTKREADRLSSSVLQKQGKALHGDINQKSRSIILEGFKKGQFNVLVTTDVAARGLDIPNVDVVIQAQPPDNVSYYIHRVGRTGRAGKSGTSILLYERSEENELKECERAAKVRFEKLRIPSWEQMKQVCIREALTAILKVPDGIKKNFEEAAEMLIKEKGDVSSLAAAMALITQAESFHQRSLITSAEGFVTLMFKGVQHGHHTMRHHGESPRDAVYAYMRSLNIPVMNFQDLRDRSGVVFDVKSENEDAALEGFNSIKKDENEVMVKLDTLPPIFESRHGKTDRSRGGFDRHRGGHDRGGYDRNRGGFDRNRGGYSKRRIFDDDDFDDSLMRSKFGGQNRAPRDNYRNNSDFGGYDKSDNYRGRGGHNSYSNKNSRRRETFDDEDF